MNPVIGFDLTSISKGLPFENPLEFQPFDLEQTSSFKQKIILQNKIYLILGLLYDVNQIQSASHKTILEIEMLQDILDPKIKDFIILVCDRLETRPKYDK